jgi:hypothetical protein
VWITQSKHELHRVDYRVFDPPIFGVKTLSYTITFAPDATGRPLPKYCDIQASGSILLFMTRKVKIHQEYLAWTRREEGR